ncbi:type VII secretion-associated serine protease mycosin [Gordonia polyisoprenivorans]|uniref:type VII secretion-associated serine protease mycosin n=1 Tax=Gordonia polyisoprenivorans TaxID=84595 RepID=UPI000369B6D3|nr:type VII secretion-associated serine protease mycosin [Gordonia polyisoprenivorans]MBE7193649.1 type VII secretion-associated serine protease mycosin [Gordonia polyisoprenivorans]UZF54680.1 type VII secretion-associated serine protease mycosin [Gordonia polyisoprenivorans]
MTLPIRVRRTIVVIAHLATVLVLVLVGTGPAAALTPPRIAAGGAPSGPVGPTDKTKQQQQCATPVLAAGTDLSQVDPTGFAVNYRAAWTYSTGAGQTVAVIDTGVHPQPRLRKVIGGGDYVGSGDGLTDCDSHGTLVAGLIAARPSTADSFSGIAPDATILSIRQNSDSYQVDGNNGDDSDAVSSGYGNTTTLAYAITRAVSLGATVINISAAACGTTGSPVDDDLLGRAVRAAYQRNVVVVAAAGNADKDRCPQNPGVDPNVPRSTEWSRMTTYASPAWFSDYVLSVGNVTADDEPASTSLTGPWVSVAAPGENVVSLSSTGSGLVNRQVIKGAQSSFNGTSFAAAVVSGVVALVRAEHPTMSAGEVIELIKRTAHTGGRGPDMATGYGLVDPIAAVDPDQPHASNTLLQKQIAGPVPPDRAATRTRDIALVVGGISVFLIAAAWALFTPLRRMRDEKTAYRDIDEH